MSTEKISPNSAEMVVQLDAVNPSRLTSHSLKRTSPQGASSAVFLRCPLFYDGKLEALIDPVQFVPFSVESTRRKAQAPAASSSYAGFKNGKRPRCGSWGRCTTEETCDARL